MRILIAPDKFKGCLDAARAAEHIASGVRAARPGAQLVCRPMADGGEGTLDVLLDTCAGQRRRVDAVDPLNRRRQAEMGLIDAARTAVIELARMAGLSLLTPRERDPLVTTTLGVGQAIRAALDAGVRQIILALGGSATVDGGAGMLQALGYRYVDAGGRILPDGIGGGRLIDIAQVLDIGDEEAAEESGTALGASVGLRDARITVLTDVLHPLTGANGAARTFAPQKGASPPAVELLERGLSHWADVLMGMSGVDVRDMPGTGAAGGTAAPLVALHAASLELGVDYLIEKLDLAQEAARADLIITGEGRLDAQSRMGKVVSGVGRLARACGVRCAAIVGDLGPGHEACDEFLDTYISLSALCGGPAEAQTRAPELLAEAARALMERDF